MGRKPSSTTSTWRALRALITQRRGVALGEPVAAGASLAQWKALLEELVAAGTYERVFRDSISFKPVPGATTYFSIMVQGEGDYHWAIRIADIEKSDPPVFGFRQDLKTNLFARDRTPPAYGPYGSYDRFTEFVRAMLDAYADM